jgi:hypothetical protein
MVVNAKWATDKHRDVPAMKHHDSAASCEAGAPVLGKARFEGFDNAVDAISHLHDRFQNRLTLNNPRFVDRYIKAELNLLIQFRVRGIDPEFFACLQREKIIGGPYEKARHRDGFTKYSVA